VVSKGICNHTGKVAGEFCSEKTYCLYTAGYAPTETCVGNHFEVKTKSADDATLFSNKGASAAPKPSSGGPAKKNTRKMF
jgi:penicillin-binding protein 1A